MKTLYLILILAISYNAIAEPDINISDTFKKTVDKIIKKKLKESIIDYVIEKDFTTGIVAKDLLGQVIDNYKNETKLMESMVNIVTTGIYLQYIRKYINSVIDENIEILKIANEIGWSKKNLLDYSCLYYYYSERIKYSLYVSPYILDFVEEKNKIESFEVKGVNWVFLVSKTLVKIKHESDLFVDVRTIEFLQSILQELISKSDGYINRIDKYYESFILKKTDKVLKEYINKNNNMKGLDFFNLISDDLTDKIYELDTSINKNKFFIKYFKPLFNLIISLKNGYINHQSIKNTLYLSVQSLLNMWMEELRNDGFQINYVFSLSGTFIKDIPEGNNSIDFTVLDQLRIGLCYNSTEYFIYFGGFFDPLIKNTIYKTGAKLYLTGVGFQYKDLYLSINGVVPYEKFKWNNIRTGLTVGYTIPIFDILDL